MIRNIYHFIIFRFIFYNILFLNGNYDTKLSKIICLNGLFVKMISRLRDFPWHRFN